MNPKQDMNTRLERTVLYVYMCMCMWFVHIVMHAQTVGASLLYS